MKNKRKSLLAKVLGMLISYGFKLTPYFKMPNNFFTFFTSDVVFIFE